MSASANRQRAVVRVKSLCKPVKLTLLERTFHMLRHIDLRPVLKLSFERDP